MRLIDADAFDKCLEQAEIEATKNQKYVFSSAINTIRGNLANAPTIEPQPKIIRCKDCKWWERLHSRCDLFQMYQTEEWYCANAELREEQHD